MQSDDADSLPLRGHGSLPQCEELFVATDVQRQNALSYGIRFAIKTALLLLGIYIAVFLVMAAMVHVMTSYNALAEIGLPADLLTPAEYGEEEHALILRARDGSQPRWTQT
jgi:hypothetical protein